MLKKIRKMLKSQEGFTLVELMIVVVILGILAGIGIQQYGNVTQRAKDAANEANIKVIKSAAQMHIAVTGNAPDSLAALVTAGYLDTTPVHPDGKAYTLKVTMPDADAEPGTPPTIIVAEE